jgi:hypothetical protein
MLATGRKRAGEIVVQASCLLGGRVGSIDCASAATRKQASNHIASSFAVKVMDTFKKDHYSLLTGYVTVLEACYW